MHRDGKEANPQEHSELCDRSECSQQRGNLKDNGYISKSLTMTGWDIPVGTHPAPQFSTVFHGIMGTALSAFFGEPSIILSEYVK